MRVHNRTVLVGLQSRYWAKLIRLHIRYLIHFFGICLMILRRFRMSPMSFVAMGRRPELGHLSPRTPTTSWVKTGTYVTSAPAFQPGAKSLASDYQLNEKFRYHPQLQNMPMYGVLSLIDNNTFYLYMRDMDTAQNISTFVRTNRTHSRALAPLGLAGALWFQM